MIWLLALNTVALITIIITIIDLLRGAKILRIRQDRLEDWVKRVPLPAQKTGLKDLPRRELWRRRD